MRLTTNNIGFVKELTEDGVTYNWYVAMKNYRTIDGRCYCHYSPEGRTIVKEYKKEDLPKSVQAFINSHERTVFTQTDENHIHYIYK